jgi:hypothetical protein
MKSAAYLWGTAIFCAVLIAVLLFRVFSLENRFHSVQAELENTKKLAPGLGEYMTTIQLHAGKLWFAAKASNWELAAYNCGRPWRPSRP